MANIHSSKLRRGYWDYAARWVTVVYMKTSKGDDGIPGSATLEGRQVSLR
jgi:hypothetical protein